MSFRIVPHTPKSRTITLDKKQQYWVLEQDGRAIAFGMTEKDARWLLELVNGGVTWFVTHGTPAGGNPIPQRITVSPQTGITMAQTQTGANQQ